MARSASINAQVAEDISSVHYPSSVDYEEIWLSRLLNASFPLEDLFKGVLKSRADIRYQRFVSSRGGAREFPGHFRSRDEDLRFSATYRSASSAPKSVILIIDTSSSMHHEQKLTIAQVVALGSVSPLAERRSDNPQVPLTGRPLRRHLDVP